ncbi:MAG: hypothetical protein Edafosvirus8_13 [Edafosvirus sp.]|uniref:Uncharacterized protein n=1 Tax=Edafosvirus sp. TaxID=2487765 RepID=A0A3G4ZXF0_9VIRU|nr:MAG: hypothetical protein Edafosvirus8_13 [Edafosvirus sp.]
MLYSKETLDFIIKARKIHGKRYNYSKSIYINRDTKVIIICSEHGKFEQKPSQHINKKSNCPKCSRITASILKRKTNKEFIKDAIEIHGNRYDYSKTKYQKCDEKVIIICEIHGEFKQKASSHLRGFGCKKCSHSLTQEDFINMAKKKHDNYYDYSKVKYINMDKKVIIICDEHGEFTQICADHIRGKGCQKCGFKKISLSNTKSTEDFIYDAKKIHDDLYDYSLVEYKGVDQKINIICKIHGKFTQTPHQHLRGNGSGCPRCAINKNAEKRMLTTDEIIQRAMKVHGNKYDYSYVNYVNCNTPIIIVCKEHGKFEQLISSHIGREQECPYCSGHFVDTKSFIKKAKRIHNNKYDYSKVEYKKYDEKIEIICKEHGIFYQKPYVHLGGSNCNKCYKQYSKPQIEWLNFLENQLDLKIEHMENIGEHKIKNSKYRADGYCEKLNTIFEFQGCFWHGCKDCFPDRQKINRCTKKSYGELYTKTIAKEKHCLIEGYNYIQIWQCQWKKISMKNEYLDKYLDIIKNEIDTK